MQRTQPRAGLYYKLVNNSVLDGLLKELIYPGLFANLGCEARPRPYRAEPFQFHHQWQDLPFGIVPGHGAGRGGAWQVWGPHGVPAGITLLVPRSSPSWLQMTEATCPLAAQLTSVPG